MAATEVAAAWWLTRLRSGRDESAGLVAVVVLACFFWLAAATAVVAVTTYRRKTPGLPGWLGAFALAAAAFGLTYWYLGSILGSGTAVDEGRPFD